MEKSLNDLRCKLTERDVLSIYALKGSGWSTFAIASKYRVSYEQVRRILKGERRIDLWQQHQRESNIDVVT